MKAQGCGGVGRRLLTREEQKKVVDDVLGLQQGDGGWCLASLGSFTRQDDSPQEKASDGYATGLVVYVLQQAGSNPKDAKVAKGLAWLKSHQSVSGAWPATSLNKKRDPDTHVGKFMSDAATAFAVMALCKAE